MKPNDPRYDTLFYDVPLGSYPSEERTFFRVFAPNAKRLWVRYGRDEKLRHRLRATEVLPGLWEAFLPENLNGQFYAYGILPEQNYDFQPEDLQAILDPYALACLSARGPGIIVDRSTLPSHHSLHSASHWQDLVILEGHLRDLLGLDSRRIPGKRVTYNDFIQWLNQEGNYLQSLHLNALEMQPLQEFDSIHDGDYHWGYMTVNFFSPTRAYASDSRRASQVEEFAHLVRACHGRGINFILDVVYNHVGEPNHLRFLGGNYFFRTNADGSLSNVTGVGNDFRSEAPMGRKLILDSLKYWIRTFDVDGFRFDLAERIDPETLRLIEAELKTVKPSVVLIAEPWSFGGHNALALRETGWSCWNDDYREFVKKYVRGDGNREGLRYFLAGCLSHLTRFPAQTINYVASHDDRTWIDSITENPHFNGMNPTENDIARTRMMFSILFMSLGIPMFAEGGDFLRSKHGINNTYRDGERNRLMPVRRRRFIKMHEFVASWIVFRRSDLGKILRPFDAPSEGFWQYFDPVENSSAMGILYNADGSAGRIQLLFLLNPGLLPVHLPLDSLRSRNEFHLHCDGKSCHREDRPGELSEKHQLAPLCCELWLRR